MKKTSFFIILFISIYNFSQEKKDTLKQKEIEEVILVSSNRTEQKIENSPIKVEVLGLEEMTEESTIKPSGIGSILGDVSGVQIQQSSAVTGNTNVRIQGLDGRYTQILRDGMPLFDSFSGGIGVLSVPPLDLQQVELIKGSASTLFGGGAIGGLVNIISRKPTAKQDATFLINQSTLLESNANLFLSKKFKKFGYTLFSGVTWQKEADTNDDGFSDVPKTTSYNFHPKIFFYPSENSTLSFGYNGTFENRNGGDMQVLKENSDNIHQYFEDNKTIRNTGEFNFQQKFQNRDKLELKTSASQFNRKFTSNDNFVNACQLNYFSEISFVKNFEKNILVLGANFQGENFIPIDFKKLQLTKFDNQAAGLFIQNTLKLNKTTIEGGLRNDFTKNFGSFFLPSLAVIHKFNTNWGTRAGIGFGYKIPNALATQNVDFPMEMIQNINKNVINAEKSVGYNVEFNYKKKIDEETEIFINQAFFLTQINNPVIAVEDNFGNISFKNADNSIISKGFDTYIKGKLEDWELYLGYTFTIAERKYLSQNQFIPLTPKNRFAMTAVKEWEKQGLRFGLEASYTGTQHRIDYSTTPSFVFLAAMMEKKFSEHFSVVLNGENLLNYKQSKVEKLYTGSISNPTFVPIWAPIDGRIINLSVKWKL